MKHSKPRSGSGDLVAVVLLVVLLLAALVFLAVKLIQGSGLKYEENVSIGSANNNAEQLAHMQEMLDRSMITMCINATPVWELSNKDAGVNWEIENPAEQATKLIRVEVIQDDTNETIYETGVIRPGTYITGTQPNTSLSEGIYSCTAYFYSYDIETEEFLGKAGTQIRLYVQS